MMAAPACSVESCPPRSLVVSFAEIAARTASSISLLNVWKPRYSNIIAEVRIAPIGFAIPLPASGGALPCTGSNKRNFAGMNIS